jgi:hypothetical protein
MSEGWMIRGFGHASITLEETFTSGQKSTMSTTQTGEDGENG